MNVTLAEGGPSPVGLEANTLKKTRGKEEEGEDDEEEEKGGEEERGKEEMRGEEGERGKEEKQGKGKRPHEQVLEQEANHPDSSHTMYTHTQYCLPSQHTPCSPLEGTSQYW